MVFAKTPPMIKLKMNSVGVYHKRIQLESGFWDENCVYLLVLFPFHFIIILALMGNGSLHLFATVNALQTGILMCITSLLLLLRPLLFDINTCHELVTYIGFVNAIGRFCYTFWTHQFTFHLAFGPYLMRLWVPTSGFLLLLLEFFLGEQRFKKC